MKTCNASLIQPSDLGVELDESDAIQWLTAVAAIRSEDGDDVVMDVESGVFGHRVTMLDFSPGRPGPFPAHRQISRVP